jgi:hypothetical protein
VAAWEWTCDNDGTAPRPEGFPVKAKVRQRLVYCKRRIQRRLRKRQWQARRRRQFRDFNIHCKIGKRTWGANAGAHAITWPAIF